MTPPVTPKPDSLSVILDQIEERANAATPGPWHVADDPQFPGKLHCVWGDMTEDATGRFGTLIARTCFAPNSQANSNLFASAKTDVPNLVKALRRARERFRSVNYGDSLYFDQELAAILASPENGGGRRRVWVILSRTLIFVTFHDSCPFL